MNCSNFPLQHLPSFGPYLSKREEIIGKYKAEMNLHAPEYLPEKVRPPVQTVKPTPTVRVSF
jgi:hypothetical protein